MDHLGVEVETTDQVTGPGSEPWEVYVVKVDAGTLDEQEGLCLLRPGSANGRHRAALVSREARRPRRLSRARHIRPPRPRRRRLAPR